MFGAKQFIATAFFYGLLIAGLHKTGWEGTYELHTITETGVMLIAAFVSFLALIRYFARRDLEILMIAAAFFGTMLLHAFHLLVTSRYFAESLSGDWTALSTWSWMGERLFLGLYLLAAADTIWTVEHDHYQSEKLTLRAVMAAALLCLSTLAIFALIPMPNANLEGTLFGRPQEVFPALFYVLGFLAFLRLNYWRKSNFDQWMLHCLLLALAGEVCMSFSNRDFDVYFEGAHIFKAFSFLILLYGLSRDIYKLYGDEASTRGRLTQNELLLAEAQEIAHVGNWEWNIASNELYWSEELHHIYGVKPGRFQLTFENYMSIVHEDDRGTVNGLIENCRTHGASYEIMHRIRHKDKGVRWLQCRGKAIRDHNGEIVRLVGTAQDITEMHLKEERFRNLLEAAPDSMVICDDNGKIRLINAQAKAMFGYSLEELLGVSMEILIPSRFRDKHVEHRKEYFRDPVTRSMGVDLDLYGLSKDGHEFPVEVSLSPFSTPDGRMVIAAVRDVTESRKAQKALARYARELERSNAELERFAYVASHDMKEPLRKIQAFGDRLATRYAGSLDETANDYVHRMQDAARRMSLLIEDMLTYSRIEIRSGAWEKVNLQKLLDSTLQSLDMVIQESGAKVSTQALPVVEGHPWQLEMLLQNLISNALKYQAPGRSPEINIRAHQDQPDPGWIEIIISDNGIGFDSEYAEKIFQPFERLHTNREYPGTGIGLSICRKIVEHHNGHITASGKPNLGATFVIHLPLMQTEERDN